MAENLYGGLIEVAVEPKPKADQEKLGVALAKLVAEDPSFGVHTDIESGQTVLQGMSEGQLNAKVEALERSTSSWSTSVRRRSPIARRSPAW